MSEPRLARRISLPLLLFFGLGNILGAGIYVLVGKVAGVAGMHAPFSFLVALVVVSFTALSYTELVSRYPVAAGAAVYVEKGLSAAVLPHVVGITIALSGLISAAVMTLGFVGYLSELLPLNETAALLAILGALGAVAIWGIGESVAIVGLLTLIEIGGLVMILWVGYPEFATLPERIGEIVPSMEWDVWRTILLGGFLAFYAFIGFEDIVNIGEEVKRPERSFPPAILLALLIATLLYIGVSLVSILIIPPERLAGSEAPFAEMYTLATGKEASVIVLISLFAIINGALVQIIMASRIFYGMSMNGWLPGVFRYVHPKTRTPVTATVAAVVIAGAFALWLPLTALAELTSTLILIVFTLVNLALFRIKKENPAPEGVRTIPIWVPLAGAAVNLLFLTVKALSFWTA